MNGKGIADSAAQGAHVDEFMRITISNIVKGTALLWWVAGERSAAAQGSYYPRMGVIPLWMLLTVHQLGMGVKAGPHLVACHG